MKTLFLDIDTQIDFMYPAGALYVPGAEQILPVIARLNQAAPELISTADAHAEDDVEFRIYPPHCVIGTPGQKKPAVTLRGQTIVDKTTVDPFAAAELHQRLDALAAEHYIVYGVVTEICVAHALRGLLARKSARIELVTDAVRALDEGKSQEVLRTFVEQGGLLTTSEAVLSRSL